MDHCIYLFTFPNGKHYVGRAKNYHSRLISHKSKATKKVKLILYYAINKYGWENVTKEIIDTANTLEEAVAKEYEYIVKYNSIRNGYNMTENTRVGGSCWVGRKDSKEFLEFKEYMKIVNSGKNNGMYGKQHSEDTIKKQKKAAQGRYSLPWFIEKYGELEGKLKYENRCIFLKNRSMNRSNNGRFQKKLSETN